MKCWSNDCQNDADSGDNDHFPQQQLIDTPTPTKRLASIRNALQQLATTSENDAATLKKELCIIVKQLDDILQSFEHEQHQVQQQLQQSISDANAEREHRRIEPSKTGNDPHRIDWKLK